MTAWPPTATPSWASSPTARTAVVTISVPPAGAPPASSGVAHPAGGGSSREAPALAPARAAAFRAAEPSSEAGFALRAEGAEVIGRGFAFAAGAGVAALGLAGEAAFGLAEAVRFALAGFAAEEVVFALGFAEAVVFAFAPVDFAAFGLAALAFFGLAFAELARVRDRADFGEEDARREVFDAPEPSARAELDESAPSRALPSRLLERLTGRERGRLEKTSPLESAIG